MIAVIPDGTKLLVPGVSKVTGEINFSGKDYITLTGSSWSNNGSPVTASGIYYAGGGSRSVLWLVGARYFTLRDIEISTSVTNPPKVVVALGRKDSGSYGWHRFEHLRVTGYATHALIYSIASEVNSWDNPSFQLVGGGAKYVFYTSQEDDLSVSPGNFIGSTNLSLFMDHFWIWNLVDDPNAALIYINGRASTGDMYFRSGSGASKAGSHVQINVVNDSDDAVSGIYVFESMRIEDTGTTKYGIKLTTDAGTTSPVIYRLHLKDLYLYATDTVLYSDNITLSQFSLTNIVMAPYGTKLVDLYNAVNGNITSSASGDIYVRNVSYSVSFNQVRSVYLTNSTYNTTISGSYDSLNDWTKYYGQTKQELRYQAMDNAYFHQYYGNSADNATANITTTNGSGGVVGPQGTHWTFVGMIRQNVNGTDYWMPYYSWTP
jgi:hypothetical protein